MKKILLLIGLMSSVLLAGCESKAYDPTEVMKEIRGGYGLRSPLFLELEENCRLEREEGNTNGKYCHAVDVTLARFRELADRLPPLMSR